MLTLRIRVVLALFPLICFTTCMKHEPVSSDMEGPPTMASSVERAAAVPFCDLIRSPERYDKSIIRTHAILHLDRENEFLFDPDCDTNHASPVWVDFDPSYIYSDKKLDAKLTELLRPRLSSSSRMAQVTVVGRFDGPKGGPYGHLDGYPTRFSIMRLEQAEEAEAMTSSREE